MADHDIELHERTAPTPSNESLRKKDEGPGDRDNYSHIYKDALLAGVATITGGLFVSEILLWISFNNVLTQLISKGIISYNTDYGISATSVTPNPGRWCDVNVNPCKNGGTCNSKLTAPDLHSCICSPGYYGNTCEDQWCDVNTNPCKNGGTCKSTMTEPDFHSCSCAPGYYGDMCTDQWCDVNVNPCRNGGTCKSNLTALNFYSCQCPTGYYGDMCADQWCDVNVNPCKNGGTCNSNLTAPDFHSCQCSPGHYGNTCRDQWCDVNINPCKNRGTCKSNLTAPDFHSCQCRPGFFGDTCTEIGERNCSKTNGVTKIYTNSYSKGTTVYCDGMTEGGGWTVFQRRLNGSVNFLVYWDDYVNGFGNLEGEFWMGLEKLHLLLLGGNYELRIVLEDWDGNRVYAKYSEFTVSNASDNYRLRVDGYSGSAGNSLIIHNNQQFSAQPRDNDHASFDCAAAYGGGWWFNRCFHVHLNAQYHSQGPVNLARGITWQSWKGLSYSLKFTEMKFRQKQD